MRNRIGNIYKVGVDTGIFTYCRLVHNYVFSFFDLFLTEEITVDEIVEYPLNYSIYIHKDVFANSDWEVVGFLPLTLNDKRETLKFFKQDLFDPKSCWIVDVEGNEIPVLPSECIGLERLAVWDFQRVEERLRDQYNKRENSELKNLRLIL